MRISLALLAMAMLAVTTAASAHSWYDQGCCSDQDCHPIPPDQVQMTPAGYRVNGTVVPYSSARPSLDRDFHICIYAGQVRCLYAPPQMF